jgi:endoglucanase
VDYVGVQLGRLRARRPWLRYSGHTRGVWIDRDVLQEKFLERTEYCGRTGTPIWVGESGPIHPGVPEVDEQRYRILSDQLEIY